MSKFLSFDKNFGMCLKILIEKNSIKKLKNLFMLHIIFDYSIKNFVIFVNSMSHNTWIVFRLKRFVLTLFMIHHGAGWFCLVDIVQLFETLQIIFALSENFIFTSEKELRERLTNLEKTTSGYMDYGNPNNSESKKKMEELLALSNQDRLAVIRAFSVFKKKIEKEFIELEKLYRYIRTEKRWKTSFYDPRKFLATNATLLSRGIKFDNGMFLKIVKSLEEINGVFLHEECVKTPSADVAKFITDCGKANKMALDKHDEWISRGSKEEEVVTYISDTQIFVNRRAFRNHQIITLNDHGIIFDYNVTSYFS